MAGKNGPTRAAGTDELERPSREFKSGRKFYVVRNPNDPKDSAPAVHVDTSKHRGMLDRSQQAQLGKLLRSVFSDVAEEPVPDRFVKLLEALAARERNT